MSVDIIKEEGRSRAVGIYLKGKRHYYVVEGPLRGQIGNAACTKWWEPTQEELWELALQMEQQAFAG